MAISIIQLTDDDWRIYSQVRLKALQTDPKVFGSSYEIESGQTEEAWRTQLQADDGAVFLLFDGELPIGITGVAVDRNDSTKRTAILWGSWLEPEYRGKGLSHLMYQARIDWAKTHPGIERIIVSHRASNVASGRANQKHGFQFTHRTEKTWRDGGVEDEVFYELGLPGK